MEASNERGRLSELSFRNNGRVPSHSHSMKRWLRFLGFAKQRFDQAPAKVSQPRQRHHSKFPTTEPDSPAPSQMYYTDNQPQALVPRSQAPQPFPVTSHPSFFGARLGGVAAETEYDAARPRQETRAGESRRRSLAVNQGSPEWSSEAGREPWRPRSEHTERRGIKGWAPEPSQEILWLTEQLQLAHQQYAVLLESYDGAKLAHKDAVSKLRRNYDLEIAEVKDEYKRGQLAWKQERSQLHQANKEKMSVAERNYKAELSRRDQQYATRLQDSLARKDKDYSFQISNLRDKLSQIDREYTNLLQESLSRQEKEHASRISGLQNRLSRIDQEHATEMAVVKDSHRSELAELQAQYAVGLSQAETRYKEELSTLSRDHDDQVMRLERERDHAQRMVDDVAAQKNSEIERLVLRMASYSTNSYRATPDKDFTAFYNSLALKINKLASAWSQIRDIDPTLDPHGFVKRNGSKGLNCRRFVGHICWSFLLRKFFRYPLGFGAFGDHGEGYEYLKDEYELFTRAAGSSGADIPGSDLEANNSRAWHFHTILDAVNSSQPPWAERFHSNIDRVARELGEILRALGGASPGQGDFLIRGMAEDASRLALQIGSQRAHILLDTCAFGDQASSLQGFTSESERTNGEALVDLMLQPFFRRVGDGHEDLHKQKILVMGKYLPQK